jgi:hypothetical protein
MSITSTQLQQQYIAYFGRPGDPEGINYWSSDATDITTAAEFADKIYAQPEYQTTTIASKTTSEQVNQLYVNLFNRSADAEGLLYWSTEIEKGTLSLSNLAFDLITAAGNPISGNEQQAQLDNLNLSAKVAAAEAYTSTVASNASALMAYQPGAAYESAVSFISSVSFNTTVNQAVITTASGLAPLNTTAINSFVGQMLQSQGVADAATAASDAQAAQVTAAADAAAAALQAAQLQAAQAEAAAAQATLANQQAITAAAAEAAAAEEAAANAPQTLILATTLDNLSGGSADDLFNGAGGTIDSDILDGGAGNDTLKVTLTNAGAGTGDDGATFQSTNIENLSFRTTGAAATNLDLGDVTGVTKITGERLAQNLVLNDVLEIPTSVNIERNAAGGDLAINFNGTTVAGTEDSTTINLNNSSGATIVNVDNIETVNLVSTDDPAGTTRNVITVEAAGSGTATEVLNISGAGDLTVTATDALTVNNSSSATVTLTPTAATTITHSGSGSLTVAAGVAAQTVTASGTGALTYTAGTGISTVTGSSGNDRFDFQGNLAATDVITGGEGTDTLVILGDAFATTTTAITGIETLEIDSDTTTDNFNFALFATPADITTVNIDVLLNNDGVTLTDTQASTYGITIPTTANTAITLADATIDLLDSSGSADAITLNLTNPQLDTAGNQNAMTVTTLNANAIETITINADSATATTTSNADDITIGTLNSSTISTLNISGDADFAITNAIDTDVDTINASGATDAVSITLSGGDVAYTGGSGVDTVSFGTSLTAADSYTGGAGTDVLNATFNSGTVVPTGITEVETFNATFSGGALDLSNMTDLTGINLTEITASAVVSGVPATTATVSQVANTGTSAINLQYAAGAAATVTLNNTGANAAGDGGVTNAATTVNNVANLTVTSNNLSTGDGFNSAFALGSLNGGSILNSLTLTTQTDPDDTLNTGNLTGINLETLTITADEANLTVGTFASANELKTLAVSNLDAGSTGNITIGNIGVTSAADELTSVSITTSGDSNSGSSVVSVGTIDAARATTAATNIDTFNINLQGNYGNSSVGGVQANDIAGITYVVGNEGTSAGLGGINLTGSLTGDLVITSGASTGWQAGATQADLVQTNTAGAGVTAAGAAANADTFLVTEANGSVGNVTLTTTAEGGISIAQFDADNIFIGTATTVGNLTFDTGTNTGAGNAISVGAIEDATTLGNISVSGSGDTTFDGAQSATTVGNITAAVSAGQTVTLGEATGANRSVIGATGGVIGATTATGAGTFNMYAGPVTTLGNVDLSGMNASTSASNVLLDNATPVGVIYTGSTGGDTFNGTGGPDVINPGLGADTVRSNDGADNITLTETVQSVDTIQNTIVGDGAAVGIVAGNDDTITGFVTGVGGDVLGIPFAQINTEYTDLINRVEGVGGAANALTNIAHTDAVVFAPLTMATAANANTVAIGAVPTANFIMVADTTMTALPAAGTVANGAVAFQEGSVATAAAAVGGANLDAVGDAFMAMWYDSDLGTGSAVLGIIENAAASSTILMNATTFSPIANIAMTPAEYTALDVSNFDFINI